MLVVAAPEKPSNVEVIENLLIIWQRPDRTNGVVTGYEVSVRFTPPYDPINRALDSSRFYFIFRQSEIPENATAHVQVCHKVLYVINLQLCLSFVYFNFYPIHVILLCQLMYTPKVTYMSYNLTYKVNAYREVRVACRDAYRFFFWRGDTNNPYTQRT